MIDNALIALRAYTSPRSVERYVAPISSGLDSSGDIVVVLDCETTLEDQNLLFGSCGIWIAGMLHRIIIFYSPAHITTKERATITQHVRSLRVENVKVELLPVDRFVDDVFYPTVYHARARFVAFNAPFDLSRLAVSYGLSRRKWSDGFTFTLSQESFKPPIRVKSLDSKKAFIEFCSVARRNQRHSSPHYRGRFLDLRTLGFALTNESLSLEKACELFQSPIKKMKAAGHGKITPEYLDYNLNDTFATYHLYLKMIDRLRKFRLDIPPEKAFSPASLGKAYLRKMGIKSFLEKNPDFSPELLGHLMTTYYGGRSEVRIRKKPTKVRLMDFTSLYPSLFSNVGLWNFVIADKIEWTDCTSQVLSLLADLDLQTLRERSIWKEMTTILQVQPDDDILPVRSHYSDKFDYTIGINHLTSTQPLWYALPDVVASKLLTGRPPKIIKAIKFTPHGKQEGLLPIRIIGESTTNPDEDLFLKLRQLRRATQERRDRYAKGSSEYEALDVIQNQLKILANSTSYGIFIEVNTEGRKYETDVYGLGEHYKCWASKKESFGYFFNPIIATMATAGARLMLAMGEGWLQAHGGCYAFCDTDSLAVSPFHWKKLQQYFEPLNPTPDEPYFLKLEKENYDEDGALRDLWFYGISAKRYVLYRLNENCDPVPVKWSSHGLGQLKHQHGSDWERTLWTNILLHAHGKITEEELLDKYSNDYAVAELSITTSNLLRRVKRINENRPFDQQIRPYNFVLVGSPTWTSKNQPVIPITQYTADYDTAPFQSFVDSKTGELHAEATQLYWKTLQKTVSDYVEHPESKFQNGNSTGKMRRRHLSANTVVYVGKESNELEETDILGLDEDSYVVYDRSITNGCLKDTH